MLPFAVLAGHAYEVLRYLAAAFDLFALPLAVLVVFGDLRKLVLCLLDTALGLIDVDVVRSYCLFNQDLHQILGDFEEAIGRCKDVPFVVLGDPDLPGLNRGDDRRVVPHYPNVAVGDPQDYKVRLAVVDHLLGRNDPAEELAPFLLLVLVLGHYSSSFSELSPFSESSSSWSSSSSSPLMPLAFSTASS